MAEDILNTQFKKLVKDYKKLVDDALAKGDLSKIPLWNAYFSKNKTKVMGERIAQNLATRAGVKEPTQYIYDKKLDLAKKLVEAENLNISGTITKRDIFLKGLVRPSMVDNVSVPSNRFKPITDYVNNNLDTPDIKAKKAFELVLNSPDALWTKGVYQQVGDLTGNTQNRERIGRIAKTFPFYQKNKKVLEGMASGKFMQMLSKEDPMTFKEAFEFYKNYKSTDMTGGSSWGELKGYTSPNNAMKFAKKAFIQNKGGVSPEGTQVKFYTSEGKPIKFNVGGITDLPASSYFEYIDPKHPEFNKIYGLNFASEKSKLNKLGKPVVSLRKSIKELPEFDEVRNVTKTINNAKGNMVKGPDGKPIKLYDLYRKNLTGAEGRVAVPSQSQQLKLFKLAGDQGALATEHGSSIRSKPFTNLSIMTPEINTAFHHLGENKNLSPAAKKYFREAMYPSIKTKDYDSQIKFITEQVTDRADEIKKFKGGTYAIPSQLARTAGTVPEDMFTNMDYEEIKRLKKPIDLFEDSVVKSGGCQFLITKALGGPIDTCREVIRKDPEGAAKKILSISEDTGPINKVKNAAMNVLNVAKKGGRFGVFAAAGAAAAGLVKEFRNDDPSTYLSSEGQQKNMLIDMVTQPVSTPTETPSTAFGDAQLPAIGAVTAAGMIPGGAELYKQRTGAGSMKRPLGGPRLDAEGAKILKNRVSPFRAALGPMSGVLGKGLAATGTPLGMLALEPLYIGQQIADGDSAGEIATNPLNYLGPAFAGSLSKEATRFAGPKMANFMRLGISPTAIKTVSRRFGLPGLGISAGISAYEMYQNKKAGRGLFEDE